MPLNTQYIPLGELLERLRIEGFVVSPAQYGRVFRVAETVFPDGLSADTKAADLQTLAELVSPIICRSNAEQERFGAVFNSVMAGQLTQTKPVEPINNEPVGLVSPRSGKAFWILEALLLGALALALGVLIYRECKPVPVVPTPPVLPCSFNVGVQLVQGNTVTFVNRNPCPNAQTYVWDFGDGTLPLSTSLTVVEHKFKQKTGKTELGRVTIRGNCCPQNAGTPPTSSTYNPAPLPFLRLPETSRYTLANWVPLLLMGLGGLLGGGWWWSRRRRQRAQAAQRPTGGPFFLSFPQQDDAIRW
jgi:LPXTG-motif cell wall-anchored protein